MERIMEEAMSLFSGETERNKKDPTATTKWTEMRGLVIAHILEFMWAHPALQHRVEASMQKLAETCSIPHQPIEIRNACRKALSVLYVADIAKAREIVNDRFSALSQVFDREMEQHETMRSVAQADEGPVVMSRPAASAANCTAADILPKTVGSPNVWDALFTVLGEAASLDHDCDVGVSSISRLRWKKFGMESREFGIQLASRWLRQVQRHRDNVAKGQQVKSSALENKKSPASF